MHFSRIFIERPIMTTLVVFAILLFGVVGYRALPVAALPSVEYPTIQVGAAMPGADPETMASSVATPLEREFSTIAGIKQMSSTNSQGSTSITVQFDLSRKIDEAAQDIQAAISRAGRPAAPNDAAAAFLSEGQSGRTGVFLSRAQLLNRALLHDRRIRRNADRAATLDGEWRLASAGVRRAEVRRSRAGGPDQLAARQIGIDDVQHAIEQANATCLPEAAR